MEIVHTEREERLTDMMTRYETPVLRVCRAYLRDAQLAEDAAQETFIKAYRALDAFRGESEEKTWLMRIAINTCKDMLRSSWFRHVDRRVTPDKLPAPACLMDDGRRELAEDVLRLPRKYLTVVLLHYYQDMTTREVAQALSLPQSTVSSRLRRAREILRVSLEGGENHD